MEEARNYKRYRLPHLQETEDSPPVKKMKLRNYDGCNRTKIMKDLLNISFMKQRLEEHDDIEEVESDPVLRNYLMATQNDYGQMFDDTVRSFLSKEGLLTDVDIRGIKDTRQRELMENPNFFASLFQENYKHDYKNPKCRIFDAKLGGLNSRLNRINRKKDLQYLKFRRRVEAEKNKMKKKNKGNDSDNDDGDKGGASKIPTFKTNFEGATDTKPEDDFPDLNNMWKNDTAPKQEQVEETPPRMEGGTLVNSFYKNMENVVNEKKQVKIIKADKKGLPFPLTNLLMIPNGVCLPKFTGINIMVN